MDHTRLPFRATKDLADAERVLAAYAARVRPLLADFAPASADARLLRAVIALDAALRGARCLDADADANADWDAILELATRVMLLRDDAGAFRLALDVGAGAAGAHQYDVADAVLCVRAAAVAALLSLYLAAP
jgi:hypothetical protein